MNLLRISFIISVLFYVMSVFSCKTSVSESYSVIDSKDTNIVMNTINRSFNKNDSLIIIPNKNNSLTLYLSEKKKTNVNPVNQINFFIYNNLKNKIDYQNKYSNAQVQWLNNNQLLLTRFFGITENNESSNIKKYIIDISTKTITEIKKNNNPNK